MKRLLIILLVLMPVISNAQGFLVDNTTKEVSWFSVCYTELTQQDIYKQILAYDLLSNVIMYDDIIVGDLYPTRLDYESLGYSRMRLPLYVSNDMFGGRVIFQFKEGRYKVSVVNMYFKGDAGTLSAGYTSISAYLDVNFKDVPRIIIYNLDFLTKFSKVEDDW